MEEVIQNTNKDQVCIECKANFTNEEFKYICLDCEYNEDVYMEYKLLYDSYPIC